MGDMRDWALRNYSTLENNTFPLGLLLLHLDFILKALDQFWTVQILPGFPGVLLRTEPLHQYILYYHHPWPRYE